MTTRGFWMQGKTYSAQDLRDLGNLWWPGSDGVLNAGGALNVAAQTTPNMTVKCADGWVKHTGYLGHNDASKNVTIATANASNPRIDLIVWRWQDQANGDATDSGDFYVVQGIPSATPAVPSTVGLTCEKLAQVLVAAGTASIASAAITDVRTLVSQVADTGWVNAAYGAGVALNTTQLQYRVKNGIAFVRGDAKLTSGNFAAATQYNITAAGALPNPDGGLNSTESIINTGNGNTARAIISSSGQLIIVMGSSAAASVNLAGLRAYLVA